MGDVSRRALLSGALGAMGVAALPAPAHACAGPECCGDAVPWSRSGLRGGTDVVLTRSVVLDRDVRVRSLVVPAGLSLTLDPRRPVTLRSSGNVTVEGVLRAAPASAGWSHVLRFEDVREDAFQGGGMVPLPSDVGLWVTGAGRLELQGAVRTPWVRLRTAAEKGRSSLALAAAPVGWRVGDELVVVPTGVPSDEAAHDRYDVARIRSVDGASVVLDRALVFDHPLVQVSPELRLGAEVLNLTRNVRVEGTAAGRSHVWIASSTRQVLEHVALRHMGPRKADGSHTKSVLGRYALHLHMCGEGSRGTKVVGVVVRDAGSHAFVPHLSNGVGFLGCVSHDTFDEAYWYDATAKGGPVVSDVVWEACVASRVRTDPAFRGFRLAGFSLGDGRGLVVRDCVAVGVQGNVDAAGFLWPEGADGVWAFARNVAHNNKVHGVFTWQNTGTRHVVKHLVSFHNGSSGISHGAYVNGYAYTDCVLYGNRHAGVLLHALSGGDHTMLFDRLAVDGAGLSEFAVLFAKHTLAGNRPLVLRDSSMRGYRRAALGFAYEGSNGASQPELADVVDCAFDGNEVWFADGLLRGAQVRLQRAGEPTVLLRTRTEEGTYVERWNARSSPVAAVARPAPRRREPVPLRALPRAYGRVALPACPVPAKGPSGRH